MSKQKVIGIQYGITITKPWNTAMYEHNSKIAYKMKQAIYKALDIAYNTQDYEQLHTIAKAVAAYGYGNTCDMEYIYEDACRQLGMTQNHWLHDNCWPDLLKKGLVEPLSVGFVGYDKK